MATDNWAFNIDKGNVNAVIFLDLKKAFDTLITLRCYLNSKPMSEATRLTGLNLTRTIVRRKTL